MDIQIGKVGRIVAGQEMGSYIRVVDDEASTGGFLIFSGTASDMQDGFDSWVENEQMLQRYFEESKWVIEWLS